MQLSDLTPAAKEDFRRYTSYGWRTNVIASLLTRFHGLYLTRQQIKSLKLQLDAAEAAEETESDAAQSD